MGFTSSTDFPTTPGAFDTHAERRLRRDADEAEPGRLGARVLHLSRAATTPTAPAAWPSTAAATPTSPAAPSRRTSRRRRARSTRPSDDGDAFVTKFNPAGSALVYSTFVGGSDFDSFSGVVLDAAGNAWLTGGTNSADFPVTAGAPDSTFNGGGDAIIAELNSDRLGAAVLDLPRRFAVARAAPTSRRDPNGDVYVTGSTFSQDFPATVGAFDRVWNGDLQIFWGDAFVTKIDIDADGVDSARAPGRARRTDAGCRRPTPRRNRSRSRSTGTTSPSAVSYTIQIDDSSAFTAPLVRDESVDRRRSTRTSDLVDRDPLLACPRRQLGGRRRAHGRPSRSFTPQTRPTAVARCRTMDLNPTTVVGGNASSGTVVMIDAATGGAVISLSSSNPAVASVPATPRCRPTGSRARSSISTHRRSRRRRRSRSPRPTTAHPNRHSDRQP